MPRPEGLTKSPDVQLGPHTPLSKLFMAIKRGLRGLDITIGDWPGRLFSSMDYPRDVDPHPLPPPHGCRH